MNRLVIIIIVLMTSSTLTSPSLVDEEFLRKMRETMTSATTPTSSYDVTREESVGALDPYIHHHGYPLPGYSPTDEEEEVMKINKNNFTSIKSVPYLRCNLLRDRHFMGAIDQGLIDEDWKCVKDQLKSEVNARKCGVFPACHVTWDDDDDVVVVTCSPLKLYVIVTVTFLMSVVICASNFLILLTIARTKSLRTPQGCFKMSLAFAGILFGGIYLPSGAFRMTNSVFFDRRDRLLAFGHVIVTHERHWSNMLTVSKLAGDDVVSSSDDVTTSGDDVMLDDDVLSDLKGAHTSSSTLAVISLVQSIVTVYSLLLLALDRFLSVRWPVRYRVGELMTKRKAAFLIGLVWVVAFVISFLTVVVDHNFHTARLLTSFSDVIVFGKANSGINSTLESDLPSLTTMLTPTQMTSTIAQNITTTPPQTSVFRDYWHGILFAFLVWGIPFLATWCLTLMMTSRSHVMLARMRHSRRRSATTSSATSRVDGSLTLTVVVMLTLFTMTSLPLLVVIVDSVVTRSTQRCLHPVTSSGLFASYYLYASTSIGNLAVYNLFHTDFRSALTRMLLGRSRDRRRSFKSSTSKSTTSKRTLSSSISNTLSSFTSSVKKRNNRSKSVNKNTTLPGLQQTNQQQVEQQQFHQQHHHQHQQQQPQQVNQQQQQFHQQPASRMSSDASTKSSEISINSTT